MLEVVDVAPNVQAVWAYSGYKMAHAYVIDGDILVEPVVVDHTRLTGWHAFLARWPRKFRAVFLTHLHPDHARGVDLIAKHLGVPLVGPKQRAEEEYGWKVLATPGHAPEHLCFWNGSVLVAGDMLYDKEPALVPAEGGDEVAYRQSCSMLRTLRPSLLLPAHGTPNFEPDEALARASEVTLDLPIKRVM